MESRHAPLLFRSEERPPADRSGRAGGDEEEAIRKAKFIARQIAEDAPRAEGRHVAVMNGKREEVGKVPIVAGGRETA